VVSIDGVRDKLRVLLVSGEPHAGERTWRNLLKSDASVDLVHFTILRRRRSRRQRRQRAALIAFPTRELFQQRSTSSSSSSSAAMPAGRAGADSISTTSRAMCARAARCWWAPAPTDASQTSHLAHAARRHPAAEPSGRMNDGAFRAQLTDLGNAIR